MDDLHDYCYAVAGIVGEMLTELYVLDWPQLQSVAVDLRGRAARFGEGLQLVNILKDAQGDAQEGRVYLPRGVPVQQIFELAGRDLERAGEFVELLRGAGAQRGFDEAGRCQVDLEVGDRHCDWNQGRWRLTVEGGKGELVRIETVRTLAQEMRAAYPSMYP